MRAPDRVTRDGIVVFEGREYDLLNLETGELKNLESAIIHDKEVLSAMLQRQDLKEDLKGTDWDKEVKLKIRVRKRQLDALQAEHIRRKEKTAPIETYAFKAVYQIYGEEGLKEVETLARQLRNQDAKLEERDLGYISKEYGLEKGMCGTKLRHKTKREANDSIEYMKAKGRNVSQLNSYRCPFCRQWHVGHKPVKWSDPNERKVVKNRMSRQNRG